MPLQGLLHCGAQLSARVQSLLPPLPRFLHPVVSAWDRAHEFTSSRLHRAGDRFTHAGLRRLPAPLRPLAVVLLVVLVLALALQGVGDSHRPLTPEQRRRLLRQRTPKLPMMWRRTSVASIAVRTDAGPSLAAGAGGHEIGNEAEYVKAGLPTPPPTPAPTPAPPVAMVPMATPPPAKVPLRRVAAVPAPQKPGADATTTNMRAVAAESAPKPAPLSPGMGGGFLPTPVPPKPTPAPTPAPPATPMPVLSKKELHSRWSKARNPMCDTWARTEGLRALWARRERREPRREAASAVGAKTSTACAGHRLRPKSPDWSSKEEPENKRLATAIGKRGGWIRGTASGLYTKADVHKLRERGVVSNLYFDHELRLMSCMIPKAGSTTLKAFFLNNVGDWPRKGGGTVHNKTRFRTGRLSTGDYMSDEDLLDILNGGRYFKFTMARNPFARTLAAYLERFHECYRTRLESECKMWRHSLCAPGGEGAKAIRPGVLVEIGQRNRRKGHVLGVLPNGEVAVDIPPPEDGKPEDGHITIVPEGELTVGELGRHMTFIEYLEALRSCPTRKVTWQNAHWLSSTDVCGMDLVTYDWAGRLEVSEDWRLLFGVVGTKAGFTERQKQVLAHSVGTAVQSVQYFSLENVDRVEKLYTATDIGLLGYGAASKGGPLRGRRNLRRQSAGTWAAPRWTPPPTPRPTPAPPPPGVAPPVPKIACRWTKLAGVAVHLAAASRDAAPGVEATSPVSEPATCREMCDARPACTAVSWQRMDASDGNHRKCFLVLHGKPPPRIASSAAYDAWMCNQRKTAFASLPTAPPAPGEGPEPTPPPAAAVACASGDWETLTSVAIHQTRGARKLDPPSMPVFGLDACRRRCENMPTCVGAAWRRGGETHQYFHKCFYVTRLALDPQQPRADFDSTYCKPRAVAARKRLSSLASD